jgi:cation:H+ antiporter
MNIEWTWPVSLVVLPIAAAIILFCGVKLTRIAEIFANITGLGQAFVGAIFIGGVTSLSGLITTLTFAYQGYASLAVSNALGGIAAQTIFLAVADLTYRKANLEHAAASESNLVQCVLLILLLVIPLIGMTTPDVTFGWFSPFSIILFFVYLFGVRTVFRSYSFPMWQPRPSDQTLTEKSSHKDSNHEQIPLLVFKLLSYGILISIAGWAVGQSGIALAKHLNIEESLVGGVITAIVTSLPELVIAIIAVRQGALNLAVGNIIGGNCFDILFIAFADLVYLDGSIYSAVKANDIFWIGLNILLVSILLLGLLRREKYGIANIGFESFLIIIIYPTTLWFVFK